MMEKDAFKYEYYRQLAIAHKNTAMLMRRVAAIHVEALEDKFFWEKTFRTLLPERSFHFITYTKTKEGNIATGCATCLSYKDFLSKEFFVCIDSDYRYLMQEKNINIEHAIFQTYAYSIENHYCYSIGINKVFEMMGLENNLFDFDSFLADYSSVLYEMFLYHLHSLSLRDNMFNKDDFKLFIGIERPSLSASKMLAELQTKVNTRLFELKAFYSTVDTKRLAEKYKQLGLDEKNAYLYFRGHNVFDRVVLPIAKEIRKKLEQKYVEHLSNDEKERFFSESQEMKSYFLENIHYGEYPEIRKIGKDIQQFFTIN